jgi:hypothetical protein
MKKRKNSKNKYNTRIGTNEIEGGRIQKLEDLKILALPNWWKIYQLCFLLLFSYVCPEIYEHKRTLSMSSVGKYLAFS